MRARIWTLALLSLSLLGGCTVVLGIDQLQGGDAGNLDGSTDAARDGAVTDVLVADAADVPMGMLDTPVDDTGAPPEDTGEEPDGGAPDAGMPDGGMLDGGMPDGGVPDGGMPDAGRDAGTGTVGVTGTVVGLPVGRTLRVGNAGTEMDVAGVAGAASFTFRVAPGASYSVSIVTAPSDLLCVLYRGAGTASADVSNVFIGCSTAMDLVSWFPFDGSAAAARGSNWTSTAGTLTYVADRVGRPSSALAPTTTADYRLARPLDGNSGAGGPTPLSTQFTVSFWVRVPASVAVGTTDGLFGHASALALSAEVQINWRSSLPYADLYFYWDGGFDRVLTSSPTALTRDDWHHLAASAMGPGSPTVMFERRIYVDGVRAGTTATCCGWGNSTTYWNLAASRLQRDDLRLYSRMLSDAEIAGIYAAENVP